MVVTTAIRPCDPRLRMILCPRKTKPSLTWVIWVFSIFSINFSLPSRKGTAFLADFLCLSFGPFYDHDKVVSVSAISNRRLPLPVLCLSQIKSGHIGGVARRELGE